MKTRVLAIATVAVALAADSRSHFGPRIGWLVDAAATMASADTAAASSITMPAGLPTEETAQAVLTASLTRHHPEWVDVAAGSTAIHTFLVYPERHDHAPVVLLSVDNQGMTDWVRAVGAEVAAEGFIAVVPDLLSRAGPNGGGSDSFATKQAAASARAHLGPEEIHRRTDAVRRYAAAIPGSNGNTVTVGFDFANLRQIDTRIDSRTGGQRVASFEMTEHAWHTALAFVTRYADAHPTDAIGQTPEGGRGGRDGRGGEGGGCGMNCKAPDLPSNFLMAATTVAHSPRKGEWIDIAIGTTTKIRTWLMYPDGNAKAPTVVVIHPGPGMDAGEPPTPGGGANWIRGIADQLAAEGFLALVPDFTSGLGPGGGNFDSFKFPDEVGRAMGRRAPAELMAILRATRDHGLKLSRANGKSATIGFCWGGGMSWAAAAELSDLNAAVVFYGGPPDEVTMARIEAPVVAFYGENDLGLAPRIAPATADMKRLGKSFEVHVYPKATHAFLYRQDLGENMTATRNAWPRAVAFLKQQMK